MPEKTKQIFSAAERGEHEIYIPTMVLAEIGYLKEKGRIDTNLEEVEQKLGSHLNFIEVPMDIAVVKASFMIDDIPELHDRLIAGTAKANGLKIISNDPAMEQSTHVTTIWK
jgi:predicted nucleic acid-binding protein